MLLDRAEEEFGDYHTFLRRTFLNRFNSTYDRDPSHLGDRTWLCRLSFVLALAEANTTTRRPIQLTPDGGAIELSTHETSCPYDRQIQALDSAVQLFEQGLKLLKVAYEDPTVDDVEALNLAVSSFCHLG